MRSRVSEPPDCGASIDNADPGRDARDWRGGGGSDDERHRGKYEAECNDQRYDESVTAHGEDQLSGVHGEWSTVP
jgi:hypothetical protein